jgi:DNA polymerase-3 subunit epsilon
MFNFFRKKKDNNNLPQCWKEYVSHFEQLQNQKIPLANAKFVVIDVESNGLDPKKDKILSIGAVRIRNNQIETDDAFELFLRQDEFNPEVVPIHGILKSGKIEKITEQNAMRSLVEYIKDDIIVGHSINFDISIINETLKKFVNDKLYNKTLDTITLYKRIRGADLKEGTSTSLDVLSDEFKIPKSDRHTAAGDAFITAILFLKILARLKTRGVTDLESLLKNKRVLF